MNAEIKNLITQINEAMNAVATRLDDLIAQISGGLSAEEATQVVADLTAERDRLQSLGANPTNPVPPDPNA